MFKSVLRARLHACGLSSEAQSLRSKNSLRRYQAPGVYRMLGAEGELLYVGKARSLKDRLGSYFKPSRVDPKIQALVNQIADIEVT